MTEILGTRGSFKAARSYGDKAIGVWEKEYGSLQAYLDMKKYRNARLYLLGKVYYFSGRMKEAADSFHAMTPCLKEAEAGQEQPGMLGILCGTGPAGTGGGRLCGSLRLLQEGAGY